MAKSNIKIDSQLIKQAKKDDEQAFELIIKQLETPVYNFVLRMVNKKEDAEDLVQETFLKIYKNIHRFDENYKFTTWVFTIATRTVYDFLRKKRRRKEVFIIDDPDHPFETTALGDAYNQARIKIDIQKGLAQISPQYRTALVLFYSQGLSYQEIGRAMKVPVNTVKTFLSRGKEKLKLILK